MLLEILKSMSKQEQAAFADACETSVAYLFQVARGHKRAGESLAINLERETSQKVVCEELRPDVDWAYLRSTESVA